MNGKKRETTLLCKILVLFFIVCERDLSHENYVLCVKDVVSKYSLYSVIHI